MPRTCCWLARAVANTTWAVRLAIGASRWRITRQFLIESIGLATLAGGLGLVAAVLLTVSLRGLRLLEFFPDLQNIEIDARVLSFSVFVTVATVLAFGLMPALLASRADVRRVVGRTQRTVVSSHRVRNGLVIAQVALSLTLVAGAGVLNRSLQNLFRIRSRYGSQSCPRPLAETRPAWL